MPDTIIRYRAVIFYAENRTALLPEYIRKRILKRLKNRKWLQITFEI